MKSILPKLILALLVLSSLNAIAVTRYVDLNSPSPTPPYTSWPIAATNIQDAIDAAVVGDLVLVTNGVYRTGGRLVSHLVITNRVAVTKALSLRSVNGPATTTIEGYKVPGIINESNAIRCVYLTNLATLSGFTLSNGASFNSDVFPLENTGGGVWSESKSTLISNCLIVGNSAAYLGGGAFSGTLVDSVLRNNESYIGGGAASSTLLRCIVADNFAQFGGGVAEGLLTNCMIVGNVGVDAAGGVFGGSLSQCLLSNNSVTIGGGGGAKDSSLCQCLIVGNNAHTGGGGTAGGMLDRCVVSNNVAGIVGGGTDSGFVNQSVAVSNYAERGGGASDCQILNSVIVGNSAGGGAGGTYNCNLLNSIVYYNHAPVNQNFEGGYFQHSCTTPLALNEEKSFAYEPLFVDMAVGNFQLQSNSPCINAGADPAYWAHTNSTDYAGQARKIGGTIDVGLHEFQSPASVLSYAWAQQYGLLTDGSVDFTDTDADGANNWQEWRADTVATNAVSVLRMVSAASGPDGVDVTWQSVFSQKYILERATNLATPMAFRPITTIIGSPSTTIFTDTAATNGGPYFYRVGVQ